MTIFTNHPLYVFPQIIHHFLDVFPHILNMSHFMKYTVTTQKKGNKSVLANNYIYIYITLFCFPTGEAHITGFSSSTDLNYHLKGDED